MPSQLRIVLATMSVTVVSFLAMAVGQDQARPKVGFKDTPMLPGNRWEGKRDGEGKWDITDIAAGGKIGITHITGSGGPEERRLRIVALAHSGNTMINPWLRPVIFGH
jgi:hypothetical protein